VNPLLTIHGWGAVTPVGFNSAQTSAAIRAGIPAFQERVVGLYPAEPQAVAPVIAKRFLKRTPADWLASLASRAIAECMADVQPNPKQTVLMIAPPEAFRGHPAVGDPHDSSIIGRIESRLRVRFHRRSCVIAGGPAAVFQALQTARGMFRDESIQHCLVGGVDSLINHVDLKRLAAAHRLRGSTNAQGLVPGEGASFILISQTPGWTRRRPLSQLIGIGISVEQNTVLGSKYSVGDGLRAALTQAVGEVDGGEPTLTFVASTFNGERYGAWEALIARPRFYRTRRERLEIMYPAMCVGEIGTAAPMLAIIVASTAMARGYAPGDRAMCETYSDEGLRGACVVGPSPDPPAFSGPGRRAN
jgi:3-oxoacyl-[acyl-carrier-protein] synthase-1